MYGRAARLQRCITRLHRKPAYDKHFTERNVLLNTSRTVHQRSSQEYGKRATADVQPIFCFLFVATRHYRR